MKKLFPILAAAAVVALWPAGAGAATMKGVVVGHLRGSVLVASPLGVVQAFSGHAAVGSRVAFANGRLVVVGRAHTARIRGIVIRRIGTTMFLSSNKHLVAVHTGRRLADASPTPTSPTTTAPVGNTVTTQVTVTNNGQLDEENEDDDGPANTNALQIQATVAAVGNGTITLTVNGQSMTVSLPAGLTLPSSLVGQTVTLSVSLGGHDGQDDQVENDNGNSGNNDSGSGDDGGDGGGD
jgi:hypothetical protein